ncbi:MAG: hypothetical protein ACLR4Z_05710 [Butyricicoccaceae bacterium]
MYGAANTATSRAKADPYEGKGKDKWSVTLTPAESQDQADECRLFDRHGREGRGHKAHRNEQRCRGDRHRYRQQDGNADRAATMRTVFGLKSINYSITANAAATSSRTKTAVQKTASATKTSVKISPSVHTVTVDGKVVKPQGYNINDNNYYKLRDVAWILNGTGSRFNVTWDGANNRILLSPNAPYVKVGGEMSDTIAAVKKLSPSTAAVAVGNKTVQLTGYNRKR